MYTHPRTPHTHPKHKTPKHTPKPRHKTHNSAALADGPGKYPELVQLRQDVVDFAKAFPTVGF